MEWITKMMGNGKAISFFDSKDKQDKTELPPQLELLRKAMTQEEQELVDQELVKLEKAKKLEKLENKTKVKLPSPPEVLEKAKTQEKQ